MLRYAPRFLGKNSKKNLKKNYDFFLIVKKKNPKKNSKNKKTFMPKLPRM
jgi:hypothetical protein